MRQLQYLAVILVSVFAIAQAQAAGDAAAGKAKAAACVACHGSDGNSLNPLWPNLAGQVPGYVAKQLKDFKAGARDNAIMKGIAAGLSKADMADLDAYYTGLLAKTDVATDAKLAKSGEHLYRGGNSDTGVAACMSCHGPNGHGIPTRFPRVSGQHAAYMEAQLKAYKSKTRNNDDGVMTRIAFFMSEEEIKAVSEYMQGLQ